jgi:hypothetical protein
VSPIIEAQALRETEESLREFITVARNIGLSRGSLALMLRTVADELVPPTVIEAVTLN